jgi:hypothetical protein
MQTLGKEEKLSYPNTIALPFKYYEAPSSMMSIL